MSADRLEFDSTEVFGLAADFSERSGFWGTAIAFIYGFAVGSGARRILETGVWHGGSTRALLQAAAVNSGHLTSIDIDDCRHAVPTEMHARWTFIHGDSRLILPAIDFAIDLAVIDGEHSSAAVSRELNELDRLMTPHGSILLDDCWSTYQGVLDAFHAFQSRRNIEKSLIRYGTMQSLEGANRTLGLIRYMDK